MHFFRKAVIVWVWLIIVSVNICRFVNLDQSPAGFHVDELSSAVTVQCVDQEGTDALGNPCPFFGDVGYGSPKPPTYIYPTLIWIRIFGSSIASFRFLAALITVCAMVGLYFFARLVFGFRYAMWTIFAASLSPWAFQFSRLNLGVPWSLFFICWGMCFLWNQKGRMMIVSGAFFSLAMYTYAPFRLYIILMMPFLLGFRWFKKGWSKSLLLAFLSGFFVFSGPLFLIIFRQAHHMERFNTISIFNPAYFESIGQEMNFFSILSMFVSNYLRHLHPDFLFFHGDKNWTYGTGFVGLISWVGSISLLTSPVLMGITFFKNPKGFSFSRDKDGLYIIFLIFGILLGIVPSALTWQDIPHSMRMIGLWPFLMLLLGYILWQWDQMSLIDSGDGKTLTRAPGLALGVCLLATIFLSVYLRHYFLRYPRKSYWMFYAIAKDFAIKAKNNNDWFDFIDRFSNQEFPLRYYLMNYRQDTSCSTARWISHVVAGRRKTEFKLLKKTH